MFAKQHEKRLLQDGREVARYITALCDANLLGNVFEEGDLFLDLKTFRAFYEGKKVSKKEAETLLKNAKNVNVVGKKSVALALKVLKVPASSVKKIAGVPHLQIYYV